MRILLLLMILSCLIYPVSALDITAPQVPAEAQEYLSDETESFAEGLWFVIQTALKNLSPSIAEAGRVCLSLLAIAILVSILKNIPGNSSAVTDFAGTVAIALLLLQPSRSLVHIAAETISQISDYGRLLLPVMATAMAAQGASVTSGGLYTATAFFDAVLSGIINHILVPAMYVYLCLCVAGKVCNQDVLNKGRAFLKWSATWALKMIIYIFTAYLSITGVVSGSADAAAIKAAKLAMSGSVPVVGGILSDASETVLVSAGVIKNSVGVYGMLALLAICISPFLHIAAQYLLLKATAAVCGVFGADQTASLVKDFSGAMGLLLAMTGTVILLFLISIVCFMKGMT